jgi:hypothetical protein
VAKCYFAKHKLVWEVLDEGLKSKIEIQWSDITALKMICPENEQGTLDLVVSYQECRHVLYYNIFIYIILFSVNLPFAFL